MQIENKIRAQRPSFFWRRRTSSRSLKETYDSFSFLNKTQHNGPISDRFFLDSRSLRTFNLVETPESRARSCTEGITLRIIKCV